MSGGFIVREMRTPLLAPIVENTFGSSSASKDTCELPAETNLKDSSGGWRTPRGLFFMRSPKPRGLSADLGALPGIDGACSVSCTVLR